MKKLLALALVAILALSLLTACKVNFDENKTGGGNNNTTSGNNGGSGNAPPGNSKTSSGDSHAFIPGGEGEIITFQFEDEEHRQAILAWLKTVLYAEDYYEFVDGEDYDVPYDFKDESPIWLDEEVE